MNNYYQSHKNVKVERNADFFDSPLKEERKPALPQSRAW